MLREGQPCEQALEAGEGNRGVWEWVSAATGQTRQGALVAVHGMGSSCPRPQLWKTPRPDFCYRQLLQGTPGAVPT